MAATNPVTRPLGPAVHETDWVCWPLLGGCGANYGQDDPAGPCPECEGIVVRIVLRQGDQDGGRF